MAYDRHSTLSIQEVLILLPNKQNKLPRVQKLNGIRIKMTPQRYELFSQKGCNCVSCNAQGVYFALERTLGSTGGYHLNLYAKNELGEEVLMTKDHILPKSKGGLDNISNYQPMCVLCNGIKGNKT